MIVITSLPVPRSAAGYSCGAAAWALSLAAASLRRRDCRAAPSPRASAPVVTPEPEERHRGPLRWTDRGFDCSTRAGREQISCPFALRPGPRMHHRPEHPKAAPR